MAVTARDSLAVADKQSRSGPESVCSAFMTPKAANVTAAWLGLTAHAGVVVRCESGPRLDRNKESDAGLGVCKLQSPKWSVHSVRMCECVCGIVSASIGTWMLS